MSAQSLPLWHLQWKVLYAGSLVHSTVPIGNPLTIIVSSRLAKGRMGESYEERHITITYKESHHLFFFFQNFLLLPLVSTRFLLLCREINEPSCGKHLWSVLAWIWGSLCCTSAKQLYYCLPKHFGGYNFFNWLHKCIAIYFRYLIILLYLIEHLLH